MTAQMVSRLVVLAVLTSACAASVPATPSASASPSPTAVALPSRAPASLPELSWERQIVDGLRAEGVEVTLVGGSKFEGLLGALLPARVFIVRPGAGGEGADVLFLDRPMEEIRVCSSPGERLVTHSIFVGGRLVSRGEATQDVRFSVSDRYFAQAFGERFDQALRRVLGTSPARC